MACAAALAVQEVIARDRLLDNVRAMGVHLSRRLGERFDNHPNVGDIRGLGLFMGVEPVEDRSTKVPFDPKRKLHARIKKEAMARGLLIYPMGGTIDGINGDHVLLAPPFICDVPAIDAIVERLGDAIEAYCEHHQTRPELREGSESDHHRQAKFAHPVAKVHLGPVHNYAGGVP